MSTCRCDWHRSNTSVWWQHVWDETLFLPNYEPTRSTSYLSKCATMRHSTAWWKSRNRRRVRRRRRAVIETKKRTQTRKTESRSFTQQSLFDHIFTYRTNFDLLSSMKKRTPVPTFQLLSSTLYQLLIYKIIWTLILDWAIVILFRRVLIVILSRPVHATLTEMNDVIVYLLSNL